MTIPNTPLEASRPSEPSLSHDILAASKYGIDRVRSRLGSRGLIIVAVAAIAAGLALNWSWLVAVGVAPLLLTALPCVVMCAIGVCMMPKGRKSSGNAPAANDIQRERTAPPTVKARSDSSAGVERSPIETTNPDAGPTWKANE